MDGEQTKDRMEQPCITNDSHLIARTTRDKKRKKKKTDQKMARSRNASHPTANEGSDILRTSQIRTRSILALPEIRSWKMIRWGNLQWHDVQYQFHENYYTTVFNIDVSK
jgi:hypothetical protein